MKADHRIISETVQSLVLHESAERIAEYINSAIGMHRVHCQNIHPTIEIHHMHIFVFYAENKENDIELIGFEQMPDGSRNKIKKIRALLAKDAPAIQSLLCMLYANIVEVV